MQKIIALILTLVALSVCKVNAQTPTNEIKLNVEFIYVFRTNCIFVSTTNVVVGRTYMMETSTNLVNWETRSVKTIESTYPRLGVLEFPKGEKPRMYYRVRRVR